jgi:hypothetical protein
LKKLLLASTLAALAMLSFGVAFWWSPFPYKAVSPVYEETEVIRFLRTNFPETGTYMIPGPQDDREAVRELRESGLAATIQVLQNGALRSWPLTLALGFVHALATTLLIGLLLRYLSPLSPSYRSKVGFVALASLPAAIYRDLANPIWWYQPWRWNLVTAVYDIGAWIVAGLVLAAFSFRPRPSETPHSSESLSRPPKVPLDQSAQ